MPGYIRFRAVLLAMSGSLAISAGQTIQPVILPVADASDIRFAQLYDSDGPVHTRVTMIVQDDQQFLWFGTPDGLQRYDGYTFKSYRPDPSNPNSLSGVYVYSLFKDRAGMLWIASDTFLDRYNPATETFTHFRSPPGDPAVIFDIKQDRNGILWLATNQGLDGLDPATGRTVRFRHDPSDPTTLDSNQTRCTLEDKQGTFWVVTPEGLNVFDRRTGKVTRRFPLHAPANFLSSALEDHTGLLWVAYSNQSALVSLDRTTGLLTRYSFRQVESAPNALSGVYAMLEDEDGTLWLGTYSNGLLKLDRSRKKLVRYRQNTSDADSVAENFVDAVFADREGGIWLGTGGGGIARFTTKPPPFRIYRHNPANPNSIGDDYVVSAYRDSHGDLWIASRGVLNRVDAKTGKFVFYRAAGGGLGGLSNSNVRSILEDRGGVLWFGTLGGGLNRFDPHTGQFKAYRHSAADLQSLSDDLVGGLLIDRKGTLWVGTETALNRFDPKTQTFQSYKPDGLNVFYCQGIADDSDGTLWLASWNGGLQRFDPATGRFTIYRHAADNPSSLPNDHVSSVHIDSAGTIWAATNGGLARFDRASHNFATLDEHDGLPSSVVIGILEDKRGDFWLATNNGLSHFDPVRKTFRNYFVSDGLAGNEFNHFGALYQSELGEMLLGSYRGLVSFFPEQVVENSDIPPVVFTDFRLFGNPLRVGADSPLKQAISVTSSVTLSHQQNIFSLEFSALSYASPDRNRYRYRLEPLEAHWNETAGNRRFASYTTLPPGHYVFRVQGSNNRGVWNENGASVQIQILPPFWSTAWFRSIAVALLVLLLSSAYYFRIQSIERQFNMRLEERVGERTRIARDLHDTLLQSLAGVSLQLDGISKQAVKNPERTPTLIGRVREHVDSALREARRKVWNLRSTSLEDQGLEGALRQIAERLTPSMSADCNVTVSGQPRPCSPEVEEELLCIAQEAANNANRHAQAREIRIGLDYNAAGLTLSIADDGKGFDFEQGLGKSGHWGLRTMQERAAQFRGTCKIATAPGQGTRIEVRLPLSSWSLRNALAKHAHSSSDSR